MIEVNEDIVLHYANKIRDFECVAGEGFIDYYFADRVKNVSWAFWLLGKGYLERANVIINHVTKLGDKYSDWDMLYHVNFSTLVCDEESGDFYADVMTWDDGYGEYFKDCILWAEFLISSDRYKDDFIEWVDNFEKGGEY